MNRNTSFLKMLSLILVAAMLLTLPVAFAEESDDLQADIVIIGAGGAGMTAAIQARQAGATDVIILEKMPMVGGNTTRSTGGLNAAETTYQAEKGVEDSIALFVEDTMKGGKELNNLELVTVMAENSAAAVDWVNEIGGDLSVVGMFGGASVERIHRPTDTSAVGPMLVAALSNKVDELGIPVLLNTKAESIHVDENGKINGVTAVCGDDEMFISCTAVVLATGGFGNNPEMIVKYNKDLEGFSTTNHPGATGDGIAMAEAVGAAFVDLEQIQTHPTVHPETSLMYTEGVRGNGAILINTLGRRFVNELETRDVVSSAILAQPDAYSWMLFDETVRQSLKAIESYITAGIVFEADTVEGLAEQIGVDPATMAETLTAYAAMVDAKADPDFGRPDTAMLSRLDTPKFYAAKCAPAVHHTMGGVKISTTAEVINTEDAPIPGLFAAGEITGGVHGANRLGGNAVTDIVVFGRIAGTSAAAYVAANGGHTEAEITVEPEGEIGEPAVRGDFKDGTYTGTGKGAQGDITVSVTVVDGSITEIVLTEHAETPTIYEVAESAVVTSIKQLQTTEGIDVVAGATGTSNGILEAVAAALEGAK